MSEASESSISRDLNESAAKYRGLLEAAPDAMVVVDPDGAIVLLNLQAEKQFGYHRDELLGKQVTTIIPKGFAERLIADGTRTAAEALEQRIGTGIELIGQRKDGSAFPIEIMLSPFESGEGILVTAAIRDISVRKAAEVHLVQSWRNSPMSRRTTCRSPCAWSRATRSSCPEGTGASSTPRRTSSSPSPSTARVACSS